MSTSVASSADSTASPTASSSQLDTSQNNNNNTNNNSSSNEKVGFTEDMNRRCRRTMEDAHCYVQDFNEKQGNGFFGIYDGHAGKSAADWCGANLHKKFQDNLNHEDNQQKPIIEILQQTFLQTDHEFKEQKQVASGCTAVVAYLATTEGKRMLYTANVGDARVVLCRNQKAIRLSYDHKGSDHQEIKRIIDSGGFIMNHRVNGVLAVTRSLGDMTMKDLIVSHPYTCEIELTKEDTFMILACDGIWDVVSDQQAIDLCFMHENPQEAADFLVQYALDNNCMDNISCMVVRFCE